MENNFELIVSIVNRGHSDNVVDGARDAGARGGTIFYGRGTSNNEKDSIMGISIEPEKEIILTLTEKADKAKIMTAICERNNMNDPGAGICFSLPVSQVRGIGAFKTSDKAE
ncbi:MAG: P-II family nitrogen regulator [Clostridia bacterium]|nr:P-II family nitrogen regulator [Clostridia bacterium]